MSELANEIAKFKDWAPLEKHRSGEWECDYEHWNELYAAAISLINLHNDGNITRELADELLYVIARDNECEHLRHCLLDAPLLLSKLAQLAVSSNESHAKWQIVTAVAEVRLDNAPDLIRPFLTDDNEYVRRRSLMAIAPISPAEAEQIAISNLSDENEYTRIAALHALHLANSLQLRNWLGRLEKDPSEHVRHNVKRLRMDIDQS
jgi:HEAT repeat protein